MIHHKPRILALLLSLLLLLPLPAFAAETEHPVVRISIEKYGDIYAELYPEYAPITVENFLGLVGKGFYDGLTFHRIISGFMIQGGDPMGDGTGGSGVAIKGEFSANGVDNPLVHDRGVLSMARTQVPDSATSQFFIMHEDSPHLDGSYAAFGRVIAGQWVVDRICLETPVEDSNGTVLFYHQPVMESVRVVDRAEAEAAAEKEAQNGKGGGVFLDHLTPLSFPVPQGWELALETSQQAVFLQKETSKIFTVMRQDFWDRLSDSTRIQYQAGGITQDTLDTEAFRREALIGTIRVDAALFQDETHSDVLLYLAEVSTEDQKAVYAIGANDGYIYIFGFSGDRSDPLYQDVLSMLDNLTFREEF